MYSAGVWLDHWTAELAGAAEIVDWHDCRDEKHAGDLGAAALRKRLVTAFGEAWVAQRWRRMITDADPNALHQQGRLAAILRETPWRRGALANVHVASPGLRRLNPTDASTRRVSFDAARLRSGSRMERAGLAFQDAMTGIGARGYRGLRNSAPRTSV